MCALARMLGGRGHELPSQLGVAMPTVNSPEQESGLQPCPGLYRGEIGTFESEREKAEESLILRS